MNSHRLLAGALVAAATALTAGPAQAAYTSAVSGKVATMTGNSASDTLVIDQAGGLLRHNRYPADPGFNSQFDFDSATAGDQTLSASDPSAKVHVDAGDGDDTMTVGSASAPATTIPDLIEFDGGNNSDTFNLDASGDTVARDFAWAATVDSLVVGNGAWAHTNTEIVNVHLGSGADTVRVVNTDPNATATLDSGAGDDSFIFGQAGKSLATVQGTIGVDAGAGTDSLLFGDSAQLGRHTYRIGTSSFDRDGTGMVTFANAESARFEASAGVDDVFKRGSMPFTIVSGASADNIVTVDSVADTVDCAGGADVVYADLFDALAASCETVNKFDTTPPAPPPPSPPSPPAPDTKPPLLTVQVAAKVTKKKLLKGVPVVVGTDEAASIQVEERAVAKGQVRLAAKSYNLTLGSASVPLGSGSRTLTLKADRKLVGNAKRFSVRFFVTAVDAAGNRTATTRTVKVRPR